MKNVLADTMNLNVIEYDFDPVVRDHADLTVSLKELAESLTV
jgi:hypothetical protein